LIGALLGLNYRTMPPTEIAALPQIPMDALRDLLPAGWRPNAAHYTCKPYADLPTMIVSLDRIEPPRRDPGVAHFGVPRLRSLASGIIAGHPILPIEIRSPAINAAFTYRVANGFHRFYLCKALGFTEVPAVDVTDLSI
jgi:hypothetical protein